MSNILWRFEFSQQCAKQGKNIAELTKILTHNIKYMIYIQFFLTFTLRHCHGSLFTFLILQHPVRKKNKRWNLTTYVHRKTDIIQFHLTLSYEFIILFLCPITILYIFHYNKMIRKPVHVDNFNINFNQYSLFAPSYSSIILYTSNQVMLIIY